LIPPRLRNRTINKNSPNYKREIKFRRQCCIAAKFFSAREFKKMRGQSTRRISRVPKNPGRGGAVLLSK
jgi:hypothetical protein